MKEDIIVFDDGSIESKVLQHELNETGLYNVQVETVSAYENLQKWLEESIRLKEELFKRIIKIFLHFPGEDYVQKDIRDQIMDLHRKHPNLRIIEYYGQAPRTDIQRRATNYGIAADIYDKTLLNRDVAEKEVSPEDKEIATMINKEIESARIPTEPRWDTPEEKPKKKKKKFGL